jgi:hypothetical protein
LWALHHQFLRASIFGAEEGGFIAEGFEQGLELFGDFGSIFEVSRFLVFHVVVLILLLV